MRYLLTHGLWPTCLRKPIILTPHILMYRILIIDDSPADCEELSRKLACFGLDIVTAMSLKGAKSMLEKSAYRDIVICDYKLPDGTSVELLEWLAKNRIFKHGLS